MDKIISSLKKEIPTDNLLKTSKILFKITKNLILHARDKKYRILSLENEKLSEHVFKYNNAKNYLKKLGFTNNNGKYEISDEKLRDNIYVKRKVEGLKLIEDICIECEIKNNRNLKIYKIKEYLQDCDEFVNDDKEENNNNNSDYNLSKTVDIKNKEIDDKQSKNDDKVKQINRNNMMTRKEGFYGKNNIDVRNVIKRDSRSNDSKLLSDSLNDDRRRIRNKYPGVFLSSEKRKSLKVERKYKYIIIRIVLFNNLIIESRYSPNETIKELNESVKNLMDSKVEFELISPPSITYKNDQMTLKEANLIPAAKLIFKLIHGKAIIKKEIMNKYFINENRGNNRLDNIIPKCMNEREVELAKDNFDFRNRLKVDSKYKNK